MDARSDLALASVMSMSQHLVFVSCFDLFTRLYLSIHPTSTSLYSTNKAEQGRARQGKARQGKTRQGSLRLLRHRPMVSQRLL